MAEYIKLEDAIAIIEEKQKELSPVGRYGRGYVYGSDREKYDAWDEIIDALENAQAADVAPVVHGRWEMRPTGMVTDTGPKYKAYCTVCNEPNKQYQPPFCPHCGAKMDGGVDHAST